MPVRPRTSCSRYPCPNEARYGSGLCAEHTPKRGSMSDRGYRKDWARIRASFLRRNPICVGCGGVANTVDHIVPLAEGGPDDASNYQPMCRRCHSRKTAVQSSGWGK